MDSQSTQTTSLTWRQSLQRSFLAGLFLLLPLLVSVYILVWLYTLITGPTVHLFQRLFPDLKDSQSAIVVSLLAFLLSIGLVLVVGVLTRFIIGRRIFRFMESLVEQVPVFNKIYGGIKQILQGFSPDRKDVFQQVVLVEFPRTGSYTIGFVAGSSSCRTPREEGQRMLNVFVPTTPNPTSGFLLIVRADQVQVLDVSVADGIKMVISGGTAVPESGFK
jgi:uncharacterized membrane protein